jgi:N-sulfoglucosamine sulfohydrolase
MDLAPTFCEAASAPVPSTMTARSILPILLSPDSGQIDEARTFVVTGRERHAANAREGNLPYPQRAIRTRDFLYIRNFAPDRYPAGAPGSFGDIDGSPTKTWMVEHSADEAIQPLFELGFGKRPAEELYDLRQDHDYMHNLAGDSKYEATRRELSERLMQLLTKQGDPRVCEHPCRYELPPYAGSPGKSGATR